MAERVLGPRELGRATLARQSLLRRSGLGTLDALELLVAMQGQDSDAPFVGLWSRLRSFGREELADLLQRRSALRAPFLRGTLHVASARDYLEFRGLFSSAFGRLVERVAWKLGYGAADLERMLASIRGYLEEAPRTKEELRARVDELIPGLGQPEAIDSLRIRLGLVQTPPAGLWGFGGRPAHVIADDWLGIAPEAAQGPDEKHPGPSLGGAERLAVRYLAAFGPASVRDAQAWSGLSRLRSAFEALAPGLIRFKDEKGRELFDLPESPRPAADTAAPARFLPPFDNVLYAYDDRSRFVPPAMREAILGGQSGPGVVMSDGLASGTWRLRRGRGAPTIEVRLSVPISDAAEAEARAEGEALARWIGGDAELDFGPA